MFHHHSLRPKCFNFSFKSDNKTFRSMKNYFKKNYYDYYENYHYLTWLRKMSAISKNTIFNWLRLLF